MYICMYACVYVGMCVCVYVYVCMRVCMYVCDGYVCMCVCVYVYVCMHVCMCVYTHACIHTYTHTHTQRERERHTHVHICIYIYIQGRVDFGQLDLSDGLKRIKLLHSGLTLEPTSVRTPKIFIANYLLSALPIDIYRWVDAGGGERGAGAGGARAGGAGGGGGGSECSEGCGGIRGGGGGGGGEGGEGGGGLGEIEECGLKLERLCVAPRDTRGGGRDRGPGACWLRSAQYRWEECDISQECQVRSLLTLIRSLLTLKSAQYRWEECDISQGLGASPTLRQYALASCTSSSTSSSSSPVWGGGMGVFMVPVGAHRLIQDLVSFAWTSDSRGRLDPLAPFLCIFADKCYVRGDVKVLAPGTNSLFFLFVTS